MSPIPRTLLIAGTALGALITSAAAPVVASGPTARAVTSTITIGDWSYNDDTGLYRVPGKVESPRRACERNRLVKFRHDDWVLRDTTNDEGRWVVRLHYSKVTAGWYKAIAVEKVVRRDGRRITCDRDTERYYVGKG